MTKKEVVEALTLIVMSYPASFKDEKTVQAMAEVWYRIFKDDNPKLVLMAIEKHISTNKWAPSIAEIREQMTNISHPEILPPDVAWSAVVDLLYAEGEYGGNTECLPPLIRQCVDAIGWHALYELHRGSYGGNKDGLDRVAFMDLYKPAYDRARETAMLPKELFASVEKATRVLGAETTKQLDTIKEKRREKEDFWKKSYLYSLGVTKGLSEESEQKLIEGAIEND